MAARRQILALENLIKDTDEVGGGGEGDDDVEDIPVFCQKQPSTPDKHCDQFSAGMDANTLSLKVT